MDKLSVVYMLLGIVGLFVILTGGNFCWCKWIAPWLDKPSKKNQPKPEVEPEVELDVVKRPHRK